MRKPKALLAATGVVAAVCGLLYGNAAGASPPARNVAGVVAPIRGGDHPHDDNGCQGPWFNAFPNGPALKNDGNNITIPKGAAVSINVIPHCVDASMTIWALHHGWNGDPNFYVYPDSSGTFGPVSWGNRPFTYSGRPGGFRGNGDQEYKITFVAANRECDAQLRSIPGGNGPGPYGPNGYYDDGPRGPAGDGPGGPGGPNDGPAGPPPGLPPGGYDHPNAYYGDGGDGPGPGDGPHPGPDPGPGGPGGPPPPNDGYGPGGPGPGPGPGVYGPPDGANDGRFGFQSIPSCCKPMGDVNLHLVDNWNN